MVILLISISETKEKLISKLLTLNILGKGVNMENL